LKPPHNLSVNRTPGKLRLPVPSAETPHAVKRVSEGALWLAVHLHITLLAPRSL
jgi:hypothetical protein